MKTINKYILLALVGAVVTTGCRKDDPTPVVEDHDHGSAVVMNIEHKAGANDFAFNTNYTDDFGNAYHFTVARVYLSGFEMLDMDMITVLKEFDHYALIDPTMNIDTIGTADDGHYHAIRFDMGIDSITNHADPAVYPADNPLAPQSPSMHWGWNNGYIFVMLEGKVDTDGDGVPETSFATHVGMDQLLRTAGPFMIHSTVEHDEDLPLTLTIDWSKFLTGIDLSTDNATHTMDNMPLAKSIADNAPLVFNVVH